MTPSFDPLNLILLAAAAIVLWRLKSVLGQRTGLEKPPVDLAARRSTPASSGETAAEDSPVKGERSATESVDPVWLGHAEAGSAVAVGLADIARMSKGFDVSGFIAGAKLAYELVLEAFAKNDKAALKPLLSKEVYDSFVEAINDRAKNGLHTVFQFVGVKSVVIESAQLETNRAAISLKFVSEMISATVDREGKAIEGDAKAIREVSDLWTFERDVTAQNPNWKLVATDDGAT